MPWRRRVGRMETVGLAPAGLGLNPRRTQGRGNEGCRYLGSCGFKKCRRRRLEPATSMQGKRCNNHSARSPKKLGLIMNPVESLSRFLLWPLCRVVFALVEGGALLPVGRLIPVPSERWTSSRDSLLKIKVKIIGPVFWLYLHHS